MTTNLTEEILNIAHSLMRTTERLCQLPREDWLPNAMLALNVEPMMRLSVQLEEIENLSPVSVKEPSVYTREAGSKLVYPEVLPPEYLSARAPIHYSQGDKNPVSVAGRTDFSLGKLKETEFLGLLDQCSSAMLTSDLNASPSSFYVNQKLFNKHNCIEENAKRELHLLQRLMGQELKRSLKIDTKGLAINGAIATKQSSTASTIASPDYPVSPTIPTKPTQFALPSQKTPSSVVSAQISDISKLAIALPSISAIFRTMSRLNLWNWDSHEPKKSLSSVFAPIPTETWSQIISQPNPAKSEFLSTYPFDSNETIEEYSLIELQKLNHNELGRRETVASQIIPQQQILKGESVDPIFSSESPANIHMVQNLSQLAAVLRTHISINKRAQQTPLEPEEIESSVPMIENKGPFTKSSNEKIQPASISQIDIEEIMEKFASELEWEFMRTYGTSGS
ncbi:hypothetical protein AB0758_46495 [Tolypothrix bouteillei VB521301_2]|uniref:Uncharacterized protein n=1 Tax=Tolypothrix bouteillei VB521301 TaxID=1479485 RepID=A0A0C1NG74_9CYAN